MADTLKMKRGQIKAKLTRFQNYFKSLNLGKLEKNNTIELNLRLEKFESCFDEFNGVQSKLEFMWRTLMSGNNLNIHSLNYLLK